MPRWRRFATGALLRDLAALELKARVDLGHASKAVFGSGWVRVGSLTLANKLECEKVYGDAPSTRKTRYDGFSLFF